MKKILVVFGTRPEVIKMAPVLCQLRRSHVLAPIVCVTAQHRQMLDQMLATFSIKPDFDLDLMTDRQTLPDLTAQILRGVTQILQKVRPDFVLVQGDTTSCFSAALAAFFAGVPVGHIEAGLRTRDKRSPFPEEMNRRLTSNLCDLHFAPTTEARDNLVREGTIPETIFVTGNTIVDALTGMMNHSPPEIAGICWQCDSVFLVTAHRRENWDEMRNICEALRLIAGAHRKTHIAFPVHANRRLAGLMQSELGAEPRIHLLPHLPYPQFIALMQHCRLVITDSGGIQEEVVTLNKPVIILRDTTERPEIIDSGFGMLTGTGPDAIVQAVQSILYNPPPAARTNPFGDGHAAERIVEHLEKALQS
jgi:UDP-N-acetylglucosamine 2-epimerase (non-hydrolysing)